MNTTARLHSFPWLIAMLALAQGCKHDGSGDIDKGPNRPPVITTNLLAVDEDTSLNSQLVVSDSDYDLLSYAVVTQAQHGTLTLSTSGRLTYTPAANYSGDDSFSFEVTDDEDGKASGTVTIRVRSINDPPMITSTAFAGVEDAPLSGQVTYTDAENDAVTFENGPQASRGTVNFAADGSFTYIPPADFSGTDTIVVRARDPSGAHTVTLPVSISAVNDAPQAVADELRLPASASVMLPLTANDIDVDGDSLTVSILTQPGGGSVSVTNGNQVSFAPDNGFNGPIRFDYRVTDAGGITADATARVVIGEFGGVYFIADLLTVGVPELFWFDGLNTTRISAPLASGLEVAHFAVSGDGQTLLYQVADFTTEQIYVTTRAGGARLLRTNAPSGFGTFNNPEMVLNHDGTQAIIGDFYAGGPRSLYHTRVSDGSATPLGLNAGQVMRVGNPVLSPIGNDFYLQAQVGGQPPPMSGTGFLTLFRGNLSTPADITQVGATYPAPSQGAGSGISLAVSADGRFAVHLEAIFQNGTHYSVLAYDGLQGVESPVYTRPASNQLGAGQEFALSPDGSRVCFNFTQPGAGTVGPGRIVAGQLASPGAAGPITPVYNVLLRCIFAGDNRTVLFFANNGAPNVIQLFSVDSDNPGAPLLVNPALAAGEEVEYHWSARESLRQVMGVRSPINFTNTLYGVSLDDPGTFTPFASNFRDDGTLPGKLDAAGHLLVYSRRPQFNAGRRDLVLLSTHTGNYSMQLTRADATSGLRQFELVD